MTNYSGISHGKFWIVYNCLNTSQKSRCFGKYPTFTCIELFLKGNPFFSAWVVMSKSCYYVTQVEVVSGGYLPALRWIIVLVYTRLKPWYNIYHKNLLLIHKLQQRFQYFPASKQQAAQKVTWLFRWSQEREILNTVKATLCSIN